MSNLQDYLKWRGDIPFDQVPVNEVDAYALAKIGAPELKGIVPAEDEGVPLDEAYERYFGRRDIDPDYLGRLNQPILSKTLRMLPDTVRFGKLLLSDYLQKYSETNTEQISALTIHLPGPLTAVTFRGTDDTIIGWKENFLMAAQNSVPAQEDARVYLERIAGLYPGPIMVCGHSKGGNLAIYAAATVPRKIQERISVVYNFDGPGFRPAFWETEGIKRIDTRIINLVSQHTMVGTLLTQSQKLTICCSKKAGPLAHEAMFWEVMGPAFIRKEKLTAFSTDFDVILDRQLALMSDEEIRVFVEDFFGILTSGGASTLTELTRQPPDKLLQMVKDFNTTESVRAFGKDLIELIRKDKEIWPAFLSRRKKDTKDGNE